MESSDRYSTTESPSERITEESSLTILEKDSLAILEGEGGLIVAERPEVSAELDTAASHSLWRISDLEHELDVARLSLAMPNLKVEEFKETETETELKRAHEYARVIVEHMPPLLILDQELRVITANSAFYSHFRVVPTQTENCLVYQLGNGQWDIPRLRLLLEEILPRKGFFKNFELTHEFPGLGKRTIVLSARRVDDL